MTARTRYSGPERRSGPKYVLGGWGPAVAILLTIVFFVLGFIFTDLRTDDAVRVAKREVRAESARADEGICVIARSNRLTIIDVLRNGRAIVGAIMPGSPEEAAQQAASLRFYDEQIERAREPFPAPCTDYSL